MKIKSIETFEILARIFECTVDELMPESEVGSQRSPV